MDNNMCNTHNESSENTPDNSNQSNEDLPEISTEERTELMESLLELILRDDEDDDN